MSSAPDLASLDARAPQPPQLANDLLTLWFGEFDASALPAQERRARWFASSAEFDAQLADGFSSAVERALAGELEAWKDTRAGRLALLLLLDQLPRNLYRGSARAFAGDPHARALASAMVERGTDAEYLPIERVFLYLPFEHSESREDQQRSVELFEQLRLDAAPEFRSEFDRFLAYAVAHRDCIDRFGRFPHRNAALGRPTSNDERSYLAEGGGFA